MNCASTRRSRTTLAAALIVSLPGGVALAADPPLEAGVYGGGTLLMGDTGLGNPYFADQQPRSSFTLGLRGGWLFRPDLSAEAELDYTPTSTAGALTVGRPGIGATLLNARASARYAPFEFGAFHPFVVGGATLAGYFAQAPEHYGLATPDLDVGLHWGLGVEYGFAEGAWALRLDLRQSVFPVQDRTYLTHGLMVGIVSDLLGGTRQLRREAGAPVVSEPEVVAVAVAPSSPVEEAPPPPVAAPIPEPLLVETIGFELDSAGLRPSEVPALERAVAILAETPGARLEVSGHTDLSGEEQLNTLLSRTRADAVKWFLVDRGAAAERIITVGHGPERPVAPNDDPGGRARNRRVELRLLFHADASGK
ncbi:MAG: OmpA family protein [Myxococcaceae bacterium]